MSPTTPCIVAAEDSDTAALADATAEAAAIDAMRTVRSSSVVELELLLEGTEDAVVVVVDVIASGIPKFVGRGEAYKVGEDDDDDMLLLLGSSNDTTVGLDDVGCSTGATVVGTQEESDGGRRVGDDDGDM